MHHSTGFDSVKPSVAGHGCRVVEIKDEFPVGLLTRLLLYGRPAFPSELS